jgi:hypothetical protein
MPALVAGIHALLCDKEGVDGRDKPGHDELCVLAERTREVFGVSFWRNEPEVCGGQTASKLCRTIEKSGCYRPFNRVD